MPASSRAASRTTRLRPVTPQPSRSQQPWTALLEGFVVRTQIILRALVAFATVGASVILAAGPASAQQGSRTDLPTLPNPTGPLSGLQQDVQPTPDQLAKLTPEQRKAVAVVSLRHVTTG